MDSASPTATSVTGQTTSPEASVPLLSMGLEERFGMAEFGATFHGANICGHASPRVPTGYRYRRPDRPRPTGYGHPA